MDANMLKSLPRAQIQKLAKRDGIKANGKTDEIIKQLVARYPGGVPRLVAPAPKRMRSVEKASTTAEDVTMRNSGEVEGKPKSRSEAKASEGSANAHGPVDQVMAEATTAAPAAISATQKDSTKADFPVNSASPTQDTEKSTEGRMKVFSRPQSNPVQATEEENDTNNVAIVSEESHGDDIEVSLAEIAAKRAAKGKGRASALSPPHPRQEEVATVAQEPAGPAEPAVTAAAVMEMLRGVTPLSAEELADGEHILEQAAAISKDVEARGPLPPVSSADTAMEGARQQELPYDRNEVASSFLLDLASNNMQGLMDKGFRMMRGLPSPASTKRVKPTNANAHGEQMVPPMPMQERIGHSEAGTASMSMSGATAPPPRRGPTKERTKEVLRELARMTTEMSELQEELDEVQTLNYLSLRRCVNMQEVLQKVRSWRKLLEREYFAKMKIDPRLTNGLGEWQGPEENVPERTFDPMVADVSDPLSSSAFELSSTPSKSGASPADGHEEEQEEEQEKGEQE